MYSEFDGKTAQAVYSNSQQGERRQIMSLAKQITTLSIATILATSVQASAATVQFLGHTAFSRQVDFEHNGDFRNDEYAGEMNITVDGQPFIAYCVDLENDAPSSWQANLLPVTVINGGKAISWLYDNYVGTVDSANKGAALQLAIWEVLDDSPGSLDLDVDDFKFQGSIPAGQFNNIKTLAAGYLASIPSPAFLATYVPNSVIVFSAQVNTAQHMIIPEPTSLSILGLGALMVMRRKR